MRHFQSLLLLAAMLANATAFMSTIIRAIPASIETVKKVTPIMTYQQKRKSELVAQMALGYGGKPASSAEEDLALTIDIIKKHADSDLPKPKSSPKTVATKQEVEEEEGGPKKSLAKDIGNKMKNKASGGSRSKSSGQNGVRTMIRGRRESDHHLVEGEEVIVTAATTVIKLGIWHAIVEVGEGRDHLVGDTHRDETIREIGDDLVHLIEDHARLTSIEGRDHQGGLAPLLPTVEI